MRLLPEMAMRFWFFLGKIFIEVTFPGPEKYFTKLIEIINLCGRLRERMFRSLARA